MKMCKDFKKVFKMACESHSTVLITGATGTGKSSLARQIHEEGLRKDKPFILVNLASLHEGTLESELFGHERGAFTGADRKRIGKLELAQGGTVFLDEVGDLSPKLQARLLEFLQSRTLSPVGSNRSYELDVRIIAATHRDLGQAVVKGEFRADLYHRLRVIPIVLKSLQERSHDFDEIVHMSLREFSLKHSKFIKGLSSGVAERLETYSWPGNIRELRNLLEYAVMATEGPEVTLESLPSWLFQETSLEKMGLVLSAPSLGTAEIALTFDYRDTLARFEKDYLQRALNRHGGRVSRTAHQIGLNKTTLLRRLRAYGLHPNHLSSSHRSQS